jgi:nucleotide-binding universal stress UspA family protein
VTDRLHIRRILCPTDFSEYSARSLRQAVALGRWFGSEVTVLHVVPRILPAGEGAPPLPGSLSPDSPLYLQAKEELQRFVEPVLHEPVVVKTRLREGTPWREIEAEARALPAGLIVMGTHGRAGFEHLMLGSVTEKLLRRAPCPMLTVGRSQKPGANRLFRRIVCAAELTEDSTQTIPFALSVAEEDEARIILLHVLEGHYETETARGEGPSWDPGTLRREIEAFALERLRRAVPDEARDWCGVEERVAAGKPYREILRVAAEETADLIVMGAHARGTLGKLFLGSNASQVVRQAACPVLIVRPTEPRPGLEAEEAAVRPLHRKMQTVGRKKR